MLWVLDHRDDLASDFSVLHRVDDISVMSAPRFFKLAQRLWAYESVMRCRFRAAAESQQDDPQLQRPAPAPQQQPAFAQQQGDRTIVPGTREAIGANPVLSRLISFG